MKKDFLFLLLAIGLISVSYADYLDDWPDEALCGWMDNPSPPSYMVEEVKKRGISCAWGVVINNLPDPSDINKAGLDSDFESVGESGVAVTSYEGGSLQTHYFNKETWLSNYGLKSEDLSPMLLELTKETQETVPECTTDFCFTMEPEYADTGEILNKGALINALYRHHPDIIATLNNDPNKKRGHDYCQEVPTLNGMTYGCYQVKEKFTYDENGETIWVVDKLFPEEADPDCNPLIGEKDIPCKNRVYAYIYSDGGAPMRPDDWLEANGLTDEDLVNLLEDYPTTYKFEGDELLTIDLNVEYSYSDEITNTDQLIKSLLFWNPYLFGSDVGHRWNYERRPDDECTRNLEPKDYEEAGCIKDILVINLPKECLEDNPPFYCMLDGGAMPPLPVLPIVQPPLEPTPPVPIRPGWKIAEGSNFWSIDKDDPYWQTEEGSKKAKAAKERESWIEQEASAYAQENPGVDPPIPSYYATDSCGEGKQPANASC